MTVSRATKRNKNKPNTVKRAVKKSKKTALQRHWFQRRLLWASISAVMAILGSMLVLFIVHEPFREKIDELYYTVYAALYIDPVLNDFGKKQANIAYCGTGSRFQKLDLYIPKKASSDKLPPVVMYIHGGGWAVGDKTSLILKTYGRDLLKKGIAVASVNYRLVPRAVYPVQNQDIACAVSYLRHNGEELGVDPRRIGTWGDSAGGQLAAMAALDQKQKGAVKAVVEFYGTADLWAQINHKPKSDSRAVAYIGGRNKQLAMKASPLNANLSGAPPFLLIHGTNDTVVPYNQSVAFESKLKAAGVDVTLQTVKHANHNFSAESRPNSTIISAQMVDFFEKQLLKD